ncbi:MAG: hypothetical protein RL685_6448 [Pseudomonadota bacterium]
MTLGGTVLETKCFGPVKPSAPRRHREHQAPGRGTAPRGQLWDDPQLDSNPVEPSLPTDGAVHTLRAEAAGHRPFVKSVRLDADIDTTVVLAPE